MSKIAIMRFLRNLTFLRNDMKKKLCLLTLPLAAGILAMTACSTSARTVIPTTSNWYLGGSDGIQPAVIVENESEIDQKAEVLTYSVTLDGGNSNYALADNSNYVTRLYAISYDWSNADNPYASSTKETVYVYETVFSVSGTYGADATAFSDSVTTKSYFRSAKNNLEPVYSVQDIQSTSPTSASAFVHYDYTLEAWYNADLTEATTKQVIRSEDVRYDKADATKNTITTATSLADATYSLFDFNMLYMAVRSFKLTSSYSATCNVFIPDRDALSTVSVSASASGNLEEADAVRSTLISAGYVTSTTDVGYIDVTLSKTNQSTLTARYAAISNVNDNRCRTTLLQFKTSVGYNFGTLTYTLQSAKSFQGV
jgi:hypothetical protein